MKDASISYSSLRHAIGILGIALPILIYYHCYTFCNWPHLQDSISHYYYTMGNVWFIGILWGLGLVLIFYPRYPGEPKIDAVLTTISGICAICVSLFPTNANSHDSCAVFQYRDSALRAGFHYLCAASMLLIFSYMSYFLFTKTHDGNDLSLETNKWKRKRNRIYRWCGRITFLSVIAVGILALLEYLKIWTPTYTKTTYWFEVTALLPFGIAWLIKGDFLLTDEGKQSTVAKAVSMFKKGKNI
jgi:hypothetical protein